MVDKKTYEIIRAIKVLTKMGLVLESSKRQCKNGTLFFSDPKEVFRKRECAKYGIFASGYARKYILGGFSMCEYEGYQLNKTYKVKQNVNYCGENHTITVTKRVKLPGEYLELAKLVAKKVDRSRNKLNKK
jgi:hypothetical protein